MGTVRSIVGAALLCLTIGVASAESRFINGTGKELKIDVLSQEAQVRDVALPAKPVFTDHVGAKLGNRGQEMIVIKDASGKELARQKMQTNALISVTMWGDAPTLSFLGYSQGDYNNDDDRPTIINVTGQEVNYKLEYADFEVSESKINGGPLGSNHDSVRKDAIGTGKDTGDKIKATFSAPKIGVLNVELVAGNTYLLSSEGGKGVLTLVRSHD